MRGCSILAVRISRYVSASAYMKPRIIRSWNVALLLFYKRNIANLPIIRNAGVKHVLSKWRADVAKASGGAANFLAIRRNHPLRGRDTASESENSYDAKTFVHNNLPLVDVRAPYQIAASRVNFEVT